MRDCRLQSNDFVKSLECLNIEEKLSEKAIRNFRLIYKPQSTDSNISSHRLVAHSLQVCLICLKTLRAVNFGNR